MVNFKQDMPPEGGYSPIIYQRIPLKAPWNPYVKIAACLLTTAFGVYLWHERKDLTVNRQIEMKCADIALIPMLEAEVDRMSLKQLKKNREIEQEVMKNVEGWEIGKYQGLKVYSSLKPDEYFKPSPDEYYVHAPLKEKQRPYYIFRDL